MLKTSPNIRSFQGKNPSIAEGVYIDLSAIIIGDVNISKNASIWPLTVVRGDMTKITIGENTNIQDGSILHSTHASSFNTDGYPLKIGNNVTIGHRVTLHGCNIGNFCLIGMNCIIMDGAKIEDKVMLAAGSLVSENKNLESGYLYLGVPAKKIRPLNEEELSFLDYSSKNYCSLKDKHLNETTLV